MENTINILGTVYTYSETTERKDARLFDKNGYCDIHEKSIAIEIDYNLNHPDCIGDMKDFCNKVKRHEIIHAYFAEFGLKDYSENELLVDWIAWQFPRILETFREVDAI